jgi:predicted DNA-binding protein with PD1-like motif
MTTITFRFKPGADLKKSIEEKVEEHSIVAGFIVTCVGGLEQAVVRMAGAKPNAQDIRTYKGAYEITSLVGTVSTNGVHIHISFSDSDGVVRGGHLKEGTIINPTAEIVFGIEKEVKYTRKLDSDTGFPELVVSDI